MTEGARSFPDQRPAGSLQPFERAIAFHAQSRFWEAEQLYKRALKADDRHFGSLYHFGLLRLQQGRFDDAARLFRRAVRVDPRSAEAHHHLAVALIGLQLPREALPHFERVLAIKPDTAETHNNLGHTLQMLGRSEEALLRFEKAVAIKPAYAEARNNLGNTLYRLGRFEEAVGHLEHALGAAPNYAEAHANLGNVLAALKRADEAIVCYEKALAISPNADTHNSMGYTLQMLGRFEEAIASHQQALSIEPGSPTARNGLARAALLACDWTRSARVSDDLLDCIAKGQSLIAPFRFLGCCGDPELQLACAKNFIRTEIPIRPPPLWNGDVWRHDRIRIGYLAAGFHQHSNAYLTAELFELHDRSRFEVLAFSLGPDDGSDMRARLVRAFDDFHDVRSKDDREVAMLIHDMQVDILVDRSGYITNARPAILAHRPAPIQVNYLGYPGTLGADFYDYVIADPIVLPLDQQPFFTEKIVHLPECYQANDSKRAIAPKAPTRQELGLPQEGFVFCCFNNNYKIRPTIFDVWMRLLRAVDGSVLWLLRDNAAAEANLRQEAVARGIDPGRLVFAARLKVEEHLARHRLADLFLDTLPYNAHTTASDALWMGLPLVTCRGESFAGRVAASLLEAIGIPELVTRGLADYEALAFRLATHPPLLAGYRERLKQHRLIYPLFDTHRYRGHLEAAYIKMWEMWQRGESPRSFAIEPLPQSV